MELPKLKYAFKRALILILLSISMVTWAHQPDVSSTMLVENENSEWILRITCSASALEYEVKKTFGADSYKSKEEFESLALKLVRENLALTANDNEKLNLSADMVKLGHETQILFKVSEMPQEFNSITVKNSSFKDIHHHQSALMVLRKGFEKKQFLLNNENDNTLKLTAESNKWVMASNNDFQIAGPLKLIGVAIILCIIILSGYKFYKSRDYTLSTNKTI
ncbi:DUF6702 family protein [uncultured Arcticibacterium sp.]|uniref:DUF6702 family protein n=1 Tax=uncultured Arcticibacterium sp. TaxID=2173042 RepID=UPI0030F7D4E1